MEVQIQIRNQVQVEKGKDLLWSLQEPGKNRHTLGINLNLKGQIHFLFFPFFLI